MKRFFGIKKISEPVETDPKEVDRLLELKQRYNQLIVELLELEYEIFGMELILIGQVKKSF